MTKAEITAEVSAKTGIAIEDCTEVVNAFIGSVKKNVINGKGVYLRGFGSVIPVLRAQKTARNISKNQMIIVPSHYAPAFVASPDFKTKVKRLKVGEVK